MSKTLYIDEFEYSTDQLAQAAWVTDAAGLELDYMEYATDGAAQAAYVSSDILSEYSSDANTQLLLHCNGSDASTTIPDSGNTNHGNATVVGNAQLDTAYKKLGTASLLLDGTGDYIYYVDHADWAFGSGNFTIDSWMRFNVLSSHIDIMGQYDGGSNISWAVMYDYPNKNLIFRYSQDGSATTEVVASWTGVVDTWYHLAFVRNGNDFLMFVNGTQVGSTHDITGVTLYDSTLALRIGDAGRSANYVNGWFDEVRISKGIARWTSNFSVSDNLNCYSESTIKNQGSYSLKAIAAITDSLNDTLTKSGLSLDLSGRNELKIDFYASRTGTNLQVQIHDSGGTTSTKDIVISSANVWETTTWDISGIADANKDDIDSIIIKVINADVANTFYVDNFRGPEDLQCYSEDTIKVQGDYSLKVLAALTGSLNKTLTKTLTDYLDYSIQDVIKFDVRASRTGTNIQLQIHDVGGTTSSHSINIAVADTWQTETWDISAIAVADRDTIDKIIIKISEATVDNTIYVDNLYSKVIVESAHVFIGG